MSEFYLSEVSDKDKPWDYHRVLADQVRDLYEGSELVNYAERVAICAQLLEFALTSTDVGEMVFKLQSARFCRVRHCPVCQWRRSLMWKARFLKALPQIVRDHSTARWIFLTLTVRNCQLAELRDTLNHMNASWNRLSMRKIFPAIGWVKSFEVTINKQDGTVHPHFHVLMMVKPSFFKGQTYINQKQWRELWQKSLRVDYEPSVRVSAIKAKNDGLEPNSDVQPLLSAIKEVFKYSVKSSDLITDAELLVELTYQLHKTRAIALGGVIRNYLSEAESETEELIHAGEDEGEVSADDPRWWFGWREQIARYVGKPKENG